MYDNPLTGKAILNIVNGLNSNNTLALLGLPKCPEIKMKISHLQEVYTENRQAKIVKWS